MKRTFALLSICIPAALAMAPLVGHADDDDHHHYRHRREHKEEYWDGQCKVERKWKENGEYKEKRKCKDRGYYQGQPVYVAPPVYAAPQPQGLVIDSRIVLRP
jgi:hypothetical protein